MLPKKPAEPSAWMVAWRQATHARWWGKRQGPVLHARLFAHSKQEALGQAAPLLGSGQFLFAVSQSQVKQGLASLVPEKTRSESHLQGAMLSWLPMVAPEFVVLSSLGADTHAHPVRAACCFTALSTFSQAYHRYRAIACAPRKDWMLASQWLEGSVLDVEFSNAWSATPHSLAL